MTAPTKPANPYPGPRSFETGETLFGRDRERRHLLNLLTHSRPDVVAHRGALTRRSRLAHVALR